MTDGPSTSRSGRSSGCAGTAPETDLQGYLVAAGRRAVDRRRHAPALHQRWRTAHSSHARRQCKPDDRDAWHGEAHGLPLPQGGSVCRACEVCILICPDLCITRDPATGRIVVDLDWCKGCGLCAHYCPKGAIKMELDR